MSKIKDFFNKYFTKTTLTIGLAALMAVGIYTTLNIRSKLSQARADLEYANALNGSILEGEKARLDSLVIVYNKSIKARDSVIVQRDRKIKTQYKSIQVLQDSLKHVLIGQDSVNADSSYNYINLRVPPTAPLKYPLDSMQVKNIHYTFLERDGLFSISAKQTSLISDLNLTSSFKDAQISDLKSLNSTYISKEAICRKENNAYIIEITGLNKTVRQQKFLKNILLPPAAVGVVLVAVRLIAK